MSSIKTLTARPAGREQPSGEEGRTPAVELVDVRKGYDGGMIKALNGLSLRIECGESVAVTGPSGCGKSTMLHLIAALDRPTSGIIRAGAWTWPRRKTSPGTAAATSGWSSSCTTCCPSSARSRTSRWPCSAPA